jgi:hypothetical protein
MSFGGGGDPGREARQQEEDRQRRIAAAVDRINSIFEGKPVMAGTGLATYFDPNQQYYDKAGTSYAVPMVQQYGSNPQSIIQALIGQGRPIVAPDTAAVMEQIRQGNLYTGVKNIAPSPRQQLYDEQKQAVFDINKRDIDRQYEMAERDNRFGLARAGLFGGSADVDSNALLQQKTNEGLMRARGIGDAAAADLKLGDERSRQQLISMAQSGIDTGTAEGMALRGLDAAAQNAPGARAGATIGSLFDDLGAAYLFNQIRAGQQAGANLYGQDYGVPDTRKSYGGDRHS